MASTQPLNNTLISLVRTGVAALVGTVVAILAQKAHFIVDPATKATAVSAVTGAAIGLYYTIVRLVESKVPAVGYLLGIPKAPAYSPAPAPAPAPRAVVAPTPTPVGPASVTPSDTGSAVQSSTGASGSPFVPPQG